MQDKISHIAAATAVPGEPKKGPKHYIASAYGFVRGLAVKPWFSYLTILLLQLRVTWNMWHFRDLTSGDTSSYFVSAYQWFHSGSAPILWSPLYLSFFGSLLHLSSDAFVVTTLHRWLTVIALAGLVLALMRRLLPYDLAWLMTAWWVILPIDFDTLYEVHLFAVIPLVVAALVILAKRSPWSRGAALAILLATAFLVRNEILLATVLLAAMLLAATIWKVKQGQAQVRLRLLLPYVIPLGCAFVLVSYFYAHASDIHQLSASMERKHTLNVCQAYAFGYQQRHADFTKSPWTECQELMTSVYRKAEPSLTDAFSKNPSAMMEHFLWNLSLIPNGLQVLLFNATSGRVNPDYAPVSHSWWALFWSCVVFAIAISGAIKFARNRRHWWREWVRARVWGWILLAALGCVCLNVSIIERPRPSYIFSLGILLRALTGMFILVLLGESVWRRRLAVAFPVIALLMIVLVPGYYAANYSNKPRVLLKGYERLVGYEKLLGAPGAVLVSPGYGSEVCNYVAKESACRAFSYFDLSNSVTPETKWPKVLDSVGASLVYADESVLNAPSGQKLVSEATSSGWQPIAFGNADGEHWMLLCRSGPGTGPAGTLGIGAQIGDIPVLGDWNGDGRLKIGIFRRGLWFLDTDGTRQLSHSKAIAWGQANDIPVVGDWNGDGRTKIGAFGKGLWYLDIDGSHQLTPSNSKSKIIGWGQAGDIPVVGDWNHDGKAKIGVLRGDTWLLDTDGSHQLKPASQILTRIN